ncbi:PREDICTED: testis-expressed sequence 2 protein [Tarenaya hassleriana]|uniref:testis-expressed sequence 2 protein n=1 Tax=Tarenaya hassleriana TaxID=28532 RepID=UPI00053C560D|nr:PREDICTED: testis-expressed sequence 2 protein [Tarenaya hassleriana]
MFSLMGFVFVSGFVLGILAIVAAEAAGLVYLVRRLSRRKDLSESNLDPGQSFKDLDPRQSVDFCLNKQGAIWVLEFDESLKKWTNDKLPKEQKRRKDFVEVHPVRRFARIKEHKLILSDADGSQTTVPLKGCSVEAVSATGLQSRKWAKKFPIKVESKTSALYKGSQMFCIYLETSWEKEAWCKALRLAACEDQERLVWFGKLKNEFRDYLNSLNAAYPSFMKPSVGFSVESLDKGNKTDGSSSKVRLFLKKFQRKYSNKTNLPNPSSREDRKASVRPNQDYQSGSGSGKSIPTKKTPDNTAEETDVPIFSRSGSHSSHISGVSEVDSEDKFYADEGTLAWNLLIARLFFDGKHYSGLKNSLQSRIQRTLSNMRTPSYVGEIICCGVDTGNLPPYIHGVRVLPMEMNQVWAFELDVEYCGGAVLDVETRVEARDMELQKGMQGSVEDVSPEILLEGLEDFEKELGIPVETVVAQELKVGDTKSDGESKGSKGSKAAPNNVSRWKSILKNIADQVSQVPISLSIRVSSLRGTLRVHIKPPPSDQLWLGFTSMPDIQFDLASSVGEHKITSSHVALFLISRFKAAIRESMVLPNCENVAIPWMLAEKDDWVDRKVAPFMWLNQETGSDRDSFEAAEMKLKAEFNKAAASASGASPNLQAEQTQKVANVAEAASSDSTAMVIRDDRSLDELKTPLLGSSGEKDETTKGRESMGEISSHPSPSRSSEEDESRLKKVGRRARMLDLGKKMGEKLEEKRRHIEEKSRHIVEKMRGPQ